MKTILVIALLIPTIVFAQKNDNYECIAETILQDCKDRLILTSSGDELWWPISEQNRNVTFLTQYIINKEAGYREKYKNIIDIGWFDFVLYCEKPGEGVVTHKNNTLSYNQNHFLWLDRPIDCAVKKYEESNFIKFEPSISFFSFAPFSINFFPISIIGGIAVLFFINRKYQFIQININKKN
ncbi:MAG: hypothetical protein WC619_02965 [Patescibacteria group bacterium]